MNPLWRAEEMRELLRWCAHGLAAGLAGVALILVTLWSAVGGDLPDPHAILASVRAKPDFVPLAAIPRHVIDAFDAERPYNAHMAPTLARWALASRPMGPFDWYTKGFVLTTRIRLELSEDERREAYLNIVWLGKGINGVNQGAQALFGHPLATMTIGESALMVANNENRYACHYVVDELIAAMQANGAITPTEAEAARYEPLPPNPNPAGCPPPVAPPQ